MTSRNRAGGFRTARKCPRCKHFEFEHGANGCLVQVGRTACTCHLTYEPR